MAAFEKRPLQLVSEQARERETLSYAADLLSFARINDSGKPIPSVELRTSPDAVLTALAQLGTLQTGASRSLISIFDEDYQYVVAEASASTALSPGLPYEQHQEDLILCGTAVPRINGVCDYTLRGQDPDGLTLQSDDPAELPLTKIDDLGAVARFASSHDCAEPPIKFYAAVPIRTKRGINIGVYCVIDSDSVPDWGSRQTQMMREISRIIMSHLQTKREREAHRRTERMNRGIGSFLEDKSTLSGWKDASFQGAYDDRPELEGSLNSYQQASQMQEENLLLSKVTVLQEAPGKGQRQPEEAISPIDPPSTTKQVNNASPKQSPAEFKTPVTAFRESLANNDDRPVEHIYDKAANIIRESIEIEGCLIFDPTSTTFGSFSLEKGQDDTSESTYLSSSQSSGDERKGSFHGYETSTFCKVLGYSTSSQHSINGDSDAPFRGTVAQKFVCSLVRRYPRGRIFNFDSKGELLSSDSSDDGNMRSPNRTFSFEEMQSMSKQEPKPTRAKPWAREHEGSNIRQILPGVRSVAFMPIWDPKKERWHAVQFAYTYAPSRCFSKEGELNFLRAFGMLTMETVLRHETLQADKAKSDALSCISHELRSPLHGVLLSVELLNETSLSVFQGDLSHTIETCSRTLVDTVDHLLDYSKINNFNSSTKQRKDHVRARGLRHGTSRTIEAGLMTLTSTIKLDSLAEEVIESVYAGFYFQYLSVRQLAEGGGNKFADVEANSTLDGIRALEDFSLDTSKSNQLKATFGDVSVFLMIDPNCQWTFYTEGGAIRRIIMNLFGNALKYTRKGVVKVSLTQRVPKPDSVKKANQVVLTVADTGAGISQDYLDNHLFQPFCQENSLSPGTGLGLSIVKRIVSHLRGRISVKSQLGIGTTVVVALPLRPEVPTPGSIMLPPQHKREFHNNAHELRGLRVCLLGFKTMGVTGEPVDVDGQVSDSISILRSVCTDWLNLEVVPESKITNIRPDLVILSEDALADWSETKSLSNAPTIVVCHNSLVAYQQATANPSAKQKDGVLEFISHPIGPHKLGRVLLLVFNRWRDLQEDSSDGLASAGTDVSPSEKSTCPTTPPDQKTSSYFDSYNESSKSETTIAALSPQPQLSPASPTHIRPVLIRSVSSVAVQYLLVDDNAINLRILSTYMTKLKRKFRTATNGQEAVEAYKSSYQFCSCIFMDISMPVMDGLEATRAIRTFEREVDLPPATVIALTGLASSEAQQEAFTSGVDLFLTKPVKLKELSSILKSRGMLANE